MTCICFSWLSIESKRGRERGRGRGHAPSISCIGMLLSIVESCARHLYWPLRLGQQYICCCIVLPSGDNKYCWQDVLWDVAAVVTFLRSALKFAAVVAVQLDSPTWRPLGVQMTPIWRPLGVHLVSSWRPFGGHLVPRGPQVGPGGAQEAQVEPKRHPGGTQMSPEGAPETPS